MTLELLQRYRAGLVRCHHPFDPDAELDVDDGDRRGCQRRLRAQHYLTPSLRADHGVSDDTMPPKAVLTFWVLRTTLTLCSRRAR